MHNSSLYPEFEKAKLYVLSGKPKVGKISFAIHSYAQLCKDKNLQNDSYGVISYSIKNDFIKGFENMELLKVVADYQLLNSSCNVLFFDFKTKPAYFDESKGEQFGTTYLNIIDVATKKSENIHYKADFRNFMFEKV